MASAQIQVGEVDKTIATEGMVLLMSKRRIAAKSIVDIVLPIYGEWALAEMTIDALAEATEGLNEGYRLYVLDNGTPEWEDEQGNVIDPESQSKAIKDKLRTQDRFYRQAENIGYPGAMNFLAAKGASPLLLILTADVVMQPWTITRMVKTMDDPTIGIVSPKLVFPDGSPHGPADTIQHAGMAFNIKGDPFHIFSGWSRDHPKANVTCDVAAVTGACFLTRRKLWVQIGGFNTDYGMGTYEDIEYCFQMRGLENRIVYLPEAWGYHHVGGSISQGAGKQGFNLTLNRIMFRGRWAKALAWDEWMRW